MSGTDKLLLVSTFVIGICTGAYLYLTGFAPVYSDIDLSFSTPFSITAHATDAASTDRLQSYQVRSDGTFRAFVRTSDGEVETVRGSLSDAQRRSLRRTLQAVNTVAGTEDAPQKLCDGDIGNPAYRYRIEFDDTVVDVTDCANDPAIAELEAAIAQLEERLRGDQ